MIYPNFLKVGSCIGVTATSDGVSDELDKIRFENGKRKLESLGYNVKFTENVFIADDKGRSSSGKQRGDEFNNLINDDEVDVIVAAKGGNFLNEMLEYVDYDLFVNKPKWFQGYSDNTGLVHTLTTKYDVATIYGSNFGEFGMDKWHRSVKDNLEILTGNIIEQHSFEKYQAELSERVTGLEGYECDNDVKWKIDEKTLEKTYKAEFTGRLIGGCLDVLIFIQGTKYDGTLEYIEKYKNDGIIWYLESFDLSAETIMMFLWQLKELGWFKYTKGVMIGRPLFYKNYTDTPYEEAVMYALGSLDIPVIFDCDFGHRGPRNTMINGAMATVRCDMTGKGTISYKLV
jgi:muramoyltetrapeptide carboxypeptidase LdcA involved in peptidoglycan recycling